LHRGFLARNARFLIRGIKSKKKVDTYDFYFNAMHVNMSGLALEIFGVRNDPRANA
jgi:hypothetical protein